MRGDIGNTTRRLERRNRHGQFGIQHREAGLDPIMLKASLGMLGFLVDDKTGRILAACAGESRHNAQRERSMIDLRLTDAVVPCITVVI